MSNIQRSDRPPLVAVGHPENALASVSQIVCPARGLIGRIGVSLVSPEMRLPAATGARKRQIRLQMAIGLATIDRLSCDPRCWLFVRRTVAFLPDRCGGLPGHRSIVEEDGI